GGLLYAGYDVGRKHDRSVLWVNQRVGDVYWTRMMLVIANESYTAQEQRLNLLMQNRSVRRVCVDATGIGAMLAERLVQRWGHPGRGRDLHGGGQERAGHAAAAAAAGQAAARARRAG